MSRHCTLILKRPGRNNKYRKEFVRAGDSFSLIEEKASPQADSDCRS